MFDFNSSACGKVKEQEECSMANQRARTSSPPSSLLSPSSSSMLMPDVSSTALPLPLGSGAATPSAPVEGSVGLSLIANRGIRE